MPPPEAIHDQVGPVELRGVEGTSAVDECTESLGGMEAPEPIVVAQVPSVVTSVVSKCVFQSVAKCVLQCAHSVGARVCVRATGCVDEAPCKEENPCMNETPSVSEKGCVSGTTCAGEMSRVSERPCVRGTACVRSLCVSEMTVGMQEHAAASPSGSVLSWCVSVVTRRCAWVEWQRRRRQMDKGRVAAVVVSGAAPGLHGSEHEVRAVLRTRPPRARLRE